MKRLIQGYRARGLSAVSINILPEKDGDVSQWASEHGVDWPALIGTNLPALTKLYGVTAAPETFILNRERRVLSWHVGYQSGDPEQIEAVIRVALGLEPFDQ